MLSAYVEIAPDALQKAIERLSLFDGEAGKKRRNPSGMFVEYVLAYLLSEIGQRDSDLAPVFKARAASDELIALKTIKKASDRRPCHTSPLSQFMRRQPVRLAEQKKQKDELAFGQAMRREPRGTIPVYGSSQCEQL